MLCTLEGEGRGAKAKESRERQAFDDANRMLREKKHEYLQPFFDEAERRHPGPTKNLNKRTKELKDKTVEVMREQLEPLMGDNYVDQLKLVKKVTLTQIKACYNKARQKEEEEREKKRKAEERAREKKEKEEEERRKTMGKENQKREEGERVGRSERKRHH